MCIFLHFENQNIQFIRNHHFDKLVDDQRIWDSRGGK